MSHSILCFTDDRKRLPELLTFATQKAEGGSVSCVVEDDQELVETSLNFGARKVYVADSGLINSSDSARVVPLLFEAYNRERPQLVVLAATKFGKEVSARLAARLDSPLGAECRSLRFTDGSIEVERTVFSGNGLAVEILKRLPAVVTIQPGLVEPQRSPAGGTVERLSVETKPSMESLEIKRKAESSAVKLEEADKIVAVGRGLQKKEDLEMIRKLAEALHAAIAGSRPLAADLGWLSDDQWVGLSGHKVKPKLYVAIGISGQIQHIAGMRDSKVVVAINKDPNAPMLANSDYYIVGDLYKIVPELIRQLGQRV